VPQPIGARQRCELAVEEAVEARVTRSPLFTAGVLVGLTWIDETFNAKRPPGVLW
jgi:hypothetical protein